MDKINDWEIYRYASVTSTNDVIKDYCRLSGRKVAVIADMQTNGRGRCGRSWVSEKGNLFFSLALEFDIRDISKLVLLCGLSLLQAVKFLSPQADVQLKWPNDVLLKGKKVSGMLLEKGTGNYFICGIGVNVLVKPEVTDAVYPVVSLSEAGIETTSAELWQCYMKFFSQNLSLLQTGKFAALREEWLKNAKNLGGEILVRLEKSTLTGIFRGIDENAALLLETSAGLKRILAGDVFFVEN